MKIGSRMRQIGAVAAVLALALTACGGSGGAEGDAAAEEQTTSGSDGSSGSTEASGETTTYKMGWAMPLSGAQASLGEVFTKFAEYGVEAVNEQYADEGIQIEMLTEDTEATAEVGVNALNKLASVENTSLVFTAWSSVVKAMAPAAEDLGVALINNGANSPELEGASEALVNFYPLSSIDINALANYMVGEAGHERAAVIYVDNATGQGAAELYKEVFEAGGGKVVAMESVAQDSVDASAQVAKIAAANPDTVHVQTLLAEAPVVMKALRDQGVDAQVTTYAGLGETTAVRESAGAAMNGVIYTSLASVPGDDPTLAPLVDRYKEEEGQEPPGLSYDIYMYDSPFLYAEAIKMLREQGKEVTGENLITALREGSFDLPLQGTVEFTEDLTVDVPVSLKQIEDASAAPDSDPVVTTIE